MCDTLAAPTAPFGKLLMIPDRTCGHGTWYCLKMIIAYIPLLFAIVGLIVFIWPKTNTNVTRVGEHMMWTGMLVTLLSLASKTVKLF